MRWSLWWVILSTVLVFSSSLSAKKHVPHYFANTVTIVFPVDEPPVAVADHFTVIEDVPRVLDVLSNDTDEHPATPRRERERLQVEQFDVRLVVGAALALATFLSLNSRGE